MKARHRKYTFKARVWKHKGPAGWHFVTLPTKLANTIRKFHGLSEEGWGRLKVNAAVKNCKWASAIWFDTKAKSYLLPIKASVRKSAAIDGGTSISVTLILENEDPRIGRGLWRTSP